MRTHEEAIAFLRHRGIPAERRDWALGDTIVVPLGDAEGEPNGIRVFPDVAWLVQLADSSCWALIRILHQEEHREHFASLDDACTAALKLTAVLSNGNGTS